MPSVPVVLADDRPDFLMLVSQYLAPKYHVVQAVSDGQAALEAVARSDPRLVILDISMPMLSGLETARLLRQRGVQAKIVFLTVHRDPDYLQAALESGATGYVLKCRLRQDLFQALEEVMSDRTFISPLSAEG